MKRWLVVTFAPSKYDEIIKSIEREEFDIEVYCPMITETRASRGIVTTKEVPLYYNYMFLRFDPEIKILNPPELKKYIPVTFLEFNNKFSTVRSKEIRRIRRKTEALINKLGKRKTSKRYLEKLIGKRVIVRDRNFDGMIGDVVAVPKKGFLTVKIMVFQRLLDYDISIDHLEIING